MRRRAFIAGIGAALVSPLTARAQSRRVAQIGFLYPGLSSTTGWRIAALREGLHSVNYADAGRVKIQVRASEGDPSKLAALAAELVEGKVDLIVPAGPSAVRAVKAATSSIPVVAIDLESDPVASGFAASLARPGGNITGIFSDFPHFGTKWIELLKETIPALSRAVILRDPTTGQVQLEAVKEAGRLHKVKLDVLDVPGIADLEWAFVAATAGNQRADAIVILSSPIFGTNPKLIAELTLKHRIPTATMFPDVARAGGLIAYGPSLLGTLRQVGTMVGKVLQGVKPAELPIERPTKFELVINLKTAKAMGLTVPPPLLARADEVIE
jgi:putative tryptophan/tyrosine transport system substrate-binding protein